MLLLDNRTTTKQADYLSGKFDGSIGLPKQSATPNYLRGYYEGLKQYLDW